MSNPAHGPRALVLFDGVCNLCNGWVRFVIARDPVATFRFASLQSDAGKQALAPFASGVASADSIALIDDGRHYLRSTAVLRIARGLRFPWPLLYAFIVVPRPLRDWVYDAVARRRYRWFGKRDVCMLPTPDLLTRFL